MEPCQGLGIRNASGLACAVALCLGWGHPPSWRSCSVLKSRGRSQGWPPHSPYPYLALVLLLPGQPPVPLPGFVFTLPCHPLLGLNLPLPLPNRRAYCWLPPRSLSCSSTLSHFPTQLCWSLNVSSLSLKGKGTITFIEDLSSAWNSFLCACHKNSRAVSGGAKCTGRQGQQSVVREA